MSLLKNKYVWIGVAVGLGAMVLLIRNPAILAKVPILGSLVAGGTTPAASSNG